MSQLFARGGQSTGVSALASFLPKNTQGWSPLEWTGWISLQSKGPSRVFFNTTVQKHQFFSAQLSSHSNSHIHTWPLEKRCHHWLDGHEFKWTLGIHDGQGGMACCDSWDYKESDTTERLNWLTDRRWINSYLDSLLQYNLQLVKRLTFCPWLNFFPLILLCVWITLSYY